MIGSLLKPELVELIRQRNFNQLRQILCDFPAPDIAEILGDLSADDKAVLLRILPQAERKIAADLLGYPKDSIGRRMTPEYIAIQQNWTVAEVLAHLRKVGREREIRNQLYVVDEKG